MTPIARNKAILGPIVTRGGRSRFSCWSAANGSRGRTLTLEADDPAELRQERRKLAERHAVEGGKIVDCAAMADFDRLVALERQRREIDGDRPRKAVILRRPSTAKSGGRRTARKTSPQPALHLSLKDAEASAALRALVQRMRVKLADRAQCAQPALIGRYLETRFANIAARHPAVRAPKIRRMLWTALAPAAAAAGVTPAQCLRTLHAQANTRRKIA